MLWIIITYYWCLLIQDYFTLIWLQKRKTKSHQNFNQFYLILDYPDVISIRIKRNVSSFHLISSVSSDYLQYLYSVAIIVDKSSIIISVLVVVVGFFKTLKNFHKILLEFISKGRGLRFCILMCFNLKK